MVGGMETLRIVVSLEHHPPLLLGTLMPAREGDENIVRYFDSGDNEAEHIAPVDCVEIITFHAAQFFRTGSQ